jgi:hypothetical protein
MAGRVNVWSPVIRVTPGPGVHRQESLPLATILDSEAARAVALGVDRIIDRFTLNFLVAPSGLEKVVGNIAEEALRRMTRGERRERIEGYILEPLRAAVGSAVHRYGGSRVGKPVRYSGGLAASIGYRTWQESARLEVGPKRFGLPQRVYRIGAPLRGLSRPDSPTARSPRAYVRAIELGSRFRVPLDPGHPGYQRLAAWAQAKLPLPHPPRRRARPRSRKTLGRPRRYGGVYARDIDRLIRAMRRRGRIAGSYVLRDAFRAHLPRLARNFFESFRKDARAGLEQDAAVRLGQALKPVMARETGRALPPERVINIVVR